MFAICITNPDGQIFNCVNNTFVNPDNTDWNIINKNYNTYFLHKDNAANLLRELFFEFTVADTLTLHLWYFQNPNGMKISISTFDFHHSVVRFVNTILDEFVRQGERIAEIFGYVKESPQQPQPQKQEQSAEEDKTGDDSKEEEKKE